MGLRLRLRGFGAGSLEAVEIGGGLVVGLLDAGDEALEAKEELGIFANGVGEFQVFGKALARL